MVARQHALAAAQHAAERIMRTTVAGYQEVFKGSGMEFGHDGDTPEEEGGTTDTTSRGDPATARLQA